MALWHALVDPFIFLEAISIQHCPTHCFWDRTGTILIFMALTWHCSHVVNLHCRIPNLLRVCWIHIDFFNFLRRRHCRSAWRVHGFRRTDWWRSAAAENPPRSPVHHGAADARQRKLLDLRGKGSLTTPCSDARVDLVDNHLCIMVIWQRKNNYANLNVCTALEYIQWSSKSTMRYFRDL